MKVSAAVLHPAHQSLWLDTEKSEDVRLGMTSPGARAYRVLLIQLQH